MDNSFLSNIFIFLITACIVVPLFSRFRLGSVLGYIAAGIVIGPFGVGLIENSEQIMHFAEFGVVMMLFMIGLELAPIMLWKLRTLIIGLGGLQVLATSALFTTIGIALGYAWQESVAVAMALALSSTALVLQMLQEKSLLHTSAGESSFAVLLFQDIAVIPILILMPLLATNGLNPSTASLGWISHLPAYVHTLLIAGVIVGIVIIGRYFSRHMFRFVARTHLREVFTATSLALVVGTTLLMEIIGVSPALGAFIAGVVLANSEYKHTIETDIAPFKGLLLGLFFISVGMEMNFSLLVLHPFSLIGAVTGLMAVKIAVLIFLARFFSLRGAQGWMFSVALAQGGEFAFVLFQYASSLHVINAEQSEFLTFVVALSMAATPFLMLLNDRFIIPKFVSLLPMRDYDVIDQHNNPVIIAGYGRFAQVVGRFLTAQKVKVTVLEKDPDQVELLRKYGQRGYFGDASRLDLLHSAGAAQAKLFIVTVGNPDKCLEIVQLAKTHFPHLKILVRARNRRHAYELHMLGVEYFRRELFDSSLTLAQEAMKLLGANADEVRAKAERFMQHDEHTLRTSFEFFEQEPELINFTRQASQEMERILQEDVKGEVVEFPVKKVA